MTPAEILTAVKARTGRTSITSIATELDGVLKDITKRYDFLKDYKTVTLTAAQSDYDIEADLAITELKEVLEVRDSDGEEISKVDNRGGFLDKTASESTGTPTLWWVYDKRGTSAMSKMLFFYPTPDTAESVTIYYSFYHPTPTSVILLPDTFKECVIEGVCYEIYRGLGEADKGQAHKLEYEAKLARLISQEPEDLSKVVYRDV